MIALNALPGPLSFVGGNPGTKAIWNDLRSHGFGVKYRIVRWRDGGRLDCGSDR